MNRNSDLSEAFKALKSIVGSNNFIDNAKEMAGYLTDWRNHFSGQSPLILKPSNTKMVS